MAKLLSGGKALAGTTGSTSIFITLPTAQPSLGVTPTTGTGFTLVTGLNGQLGFTTTLGSIYFQDGVVQRIKPGTDLILQSNGTGTVQLNGNVQFNGQSLNSYLSSLTNIVSENLTVTNLTVRGAIQFTSATSTATFAGSVRISRDLKIDQQLQALGNVQLSPDGGIVDIRPKFGGTVLINPGETGRMDNMNIGDLLPANGQFVELTSTNLTVYNRSTFGSGDFSNGLTVSSGTFNVTATSYLNTVYIAGTSTFGLSATFEAPVTMSGVGTGLTVTNAVYAGSLYDNSERVITSATVIAGVGLSGGGVLNGPHSTIALTNTGVITLIAGTDTAISTSSGNVTVWNTSTFQSVTQRGNTTNQSLRFTNASTATGNTWTAAPYIFDGDVGFGNDIYIRGNFYASGKAVITTATLGGSLNQGDDITIVTNTSTGEITWNDISTLQSVTNRGAQTNHVVTFTNTTTALSTVTGAIQVAGGIGVGKDVYVGGNVYSIGGGVPYYNYQLYTPQVTVSTTAPVSARIGDFWINPTSGVEYQYVPNGVNGTQTVWIQFVSI